jgi:hypothetical protein
MMTMTTTTTTVTTITTTITVTEEKKMMKCFPDIIRLLMKFVGRQSIAHYMLNLHISFNIDEYVVLVCVLIGTIRKEFDEDHQNIVLIDNNNNNKRVCVASNIHNRICFNLAIDISYRNLSSFDFVCVACRWK